MDDMRDEWATVIEQVARDGLPGPRDLDAALDALEAALGIPAATLRGLRDGSLVAVPREPTEAWWNSVAVRLDAHTSSLFMERLRDAHAQLMLAAAQEPGP